jgi:hypothetical protein
MRRFFAATRLDPARFFTAQTRRQLDKVRPPQDTWRDRLRDDQIAALYDALGPSLAEYGYGDDAEPPA